MPHPPKCRQKMSAAWRSATLQSIYRIISKGWDSFFAYFCSSVHANYSDMVTILKLTFLRYNLPTIKCTHFKCLWQRYWQVLINVYHPNKHHNKQDVEHLITPKKSPEPLPGRPYPLPQSQSQTTTDLSPVAKLDLSILEFRASGIRLYILISVCLLPFSIIFLRFPQVICISRSFPSLQLSSIPRYRHATVHLLMGPRVVSSLRWVMAKLLWALTFKAPRGRIFLFLLGKWVREELLGQTVNARWVPWIAMKLFHKLMVWWHLPTSNASSRCSSPRRQPFSPDIPMGVCLLVLICFSLITRANRVSLKTL